MHVENWQQSIDRAIEKVQANHTADCLWLDIEGRIHEEGLDRLQEIASIKTLHHVLSLYEEAASPFENETAHSLHPDEKEPWKARDSLLFELYSRTEKDWYGTMQLYVDASQPDWQGPGTEPKPPYFYFDYKTWGYLGGPEFDYIAVRVSVVRELLEKADRHLRRCLHCDAVRQDYIQLVEKAERPLCPQCNSVID